MSTALTVHQSNPRNRRPQIFAGLLLAKNNDAEDIANAIPMSAGSGAPNHNALVAGEIYFRTDGTAAAGTLLYAATNTSGTWAPVVNLSGFAPTAISLTDNTAAALDISEAANMYMRFTTTNGSEAVVTGKPLLLSGGLAPGSVFTSTEQTGTGSPQTVAHGLGSTPSKYWPALSSVGAGGAALTSISVDGTNITFTLTAGAKVYWHAIK
jgi:hypothetical protein